MSFVAVDLGASNTRYVSDSGKISVLPNNMVMLNVEDTVDMKPSDDLIESALEVNIVKEEESEFFNVKALIGQMAGSHSSYNDRPMTSSHKHTQQINYVSGIVAAALSRIKFGIDEELSLYIALPPIEVKTAKELVKKNFMGKYTVTFPKFNGGTTVQLTIIDVKCYEESFLASVSYFFDANGKIKEDSRDLMTGNILSLDIGASTTDIAIIQDARYLDKTGQTYKTGGNIARDYLSNAIRAKYGLDLGAEQAEQIMAEGRMPSGNSYIDVSKIVADAKMECARGIIASMETYFKQVEIPINFIRAIVVSGGGSMHSQYVNENGEVVVTTDPMSSYITSALTKTWTGIDVKHYGNSPRLANISGLFIGARNDENKKQRAKQVVAVAEQNTDTPSI